VENENRYAPESFEESFSKFQAFLAKNAYPTAVVWLRPTDIVLAGGNKIYVRLPVSPENERAARDELAESAAPSRHGLSCDRIERHHHVRLHLATQKSR
jgi:hypothetical protein